MESTPNKRKETNINSSCLVEFFSRPPGAGPPAPVPSSVDENWTGVYIRTIWIVEGATTLVYFGSLYDSSANVADGAFREARVCSRTATLKYLVSAND